MTKKANNRVVIWAYQDEATVQTLCQPKGPLPFMINIYTCFGAEGRPVHVIIARTGHAPVILLFYNTPKLGGEIRKMAICLIKFAFTMWHTFAAWSRLTTWDTWKLIDNDWYTNNRILYKIHSTQRQWKLIRVILGSKVSSFKLLTGSNLRDSLESTSIWRKMKSIMWMIVKYDKW